MSNPKPKRLVIDTSVYINYTRHQKLFRLVDAIFTYELIVTISAHLINELQRNIPLTSAIELPQAVYDEYLVTIKSVCIIFEPVALFTDSPDPKDNFLWDLALQTNSEIIVTKENALLSYLNSPIPVHDIKWFKETYPVSL